MHEVPLVVPSHDKAHPGCRFRSAFGKVHADADRPLPVVDLPTSGESVAFEFLIGGEGIVSDTFLKPMLLGRGVDVPMLVILIGALGGMMTSGIIGLFVGAVVLALGYVLFMDWLRQTPPAAQDEESAA